MAEESRENSLSDKTTEESPIELNKILFDLMEKAERHVTQIDPIIHFAYDKLKKYQSLRKLDTVHIVGSVGNKLYFPEKLSDGSYQVELDVLFSRSMPNVPLPISDVEGNKVPVATLVPEMRLFGDSGKNEDIGGASNVTTNAYSCLLEVKSLEGEISDFDKDSLFKTMHDGKVYLKSNGYMWSIPKRFERSILQEREIETFGPPLLLPLYRTFKTDILTINAGEQTFRCSFLMDKVAAINAPWPEEANQFKSRVRKWPDCCVIDDIISDGCLLIHKPSSNSATYHLEWKITFSISEQRLSQQFSFQQRFLFILFKLIKRKYLDMGTFKSGESRAGLTTYHMKTIFLWMCESTEEKVWSESPGLCFRMFFVRLKECIEKQSCPHYFMPQMNVMAEMWAYRKVNVDEHDALYENPLSVQQTLVKTIGDILSRPQAFLTDDLFHVVDEKHVFERQKEVVLSDPFGNFLDNAIHQLEDGNYSRPEMLESLLQFIGKDKDGSK